MEPAPLAYIGAALPATAALVVAVRSRRTANRRSGWVLVTGLVATAAWFVGVAVGRQV